MYTAVNGIITGGACRWYSARVLLTVHSGVIHWFRGFAR